tara:strand:- start:35835 stop:36791 length:957 start_codon:yes stop_codon:yes gene_type:complete
MTTWDYDVVVYLGSLPRIQNHNIKVQVMRAFAEGAKRCGVKVLVDENLRNRQVYNSRLAVILGWVGMSYSGPHIYFRDSVIHQQDLTGGKLMSIDGSCFKFHSTHGNIWLRYSLDNVFWNTGNYANKNSSNKHWNMIKQSLNLSDSPWHNGGENILICLQRDNGWNAKGFDQEFWLKKTIKFIQGRTNEPIKVRAHPGDLNRDRTKTKHDWSWVNQYHNVELIDSINVTLHQSMKTARCAVFYNSSSSVLSVLKGIPTFVAEESAVTWDVANHNLKNIMQPAMPDRTQWFCDLAQAHWSLEQSRNGDIYRHFEQYLPT